MKRHPPIIDHSREGAVVFVFVVECVALPWKPQRGHKNTHGNADMQSEMMCAEAPSLTLVPDGPFDNRTEQGMDHCIPQGRISGWWPCSSVKSEVWCYSVSELKISPQVRTFQ